MTRDSLTKVRTLLNEIDDLIYHDARSRGPEDYTLTDDEVKLTEIVDEAQGQATAMWRATVQ